MEKKETLKHGEIMYRYAFKIYKTHYVCFDCRKAFKKARIEDLAIQNGDWENYKKVFLNPQSQESKKFIKENPELVKYLTDTYQNREEKCPQCGSIMADLGVDFKAPKKERIKEWEIIRRLVASGKSFQTCGSGGIGFVPQKKSDYKKYLLDMRSYYELRLKNRDALKHKENISDYIDRFTKVIDKINTELEKL